MKKIIVVGGGAAGMMAAISAAQNGAQVRLLEKNEKLGKKLFITGKGRCNITNSCDAETFFGNIVSNAKFMFSSFYEFDNTCIVTMLEEAGCITKTERGNRVFPESDHSSDVIDALKRLLKSYGVSAELNTNVRRILIKDNKCYGVATDKGELTCDAVILATGGLSYSSTGSTGDGIEWANQSGHDIVECRPALVPLNIKEEWVKDLQGLSLKNVKLTLTCGDKKIYEDFGEMLFTHFGVSGPIVLSASSYLASYSIKKPELRNTAKLNLDLKSAITEDQLDKRIIRDFEKYNNKKFKNSLDDLLPSKMIPVVIRLCGIDPEKQVNLVTREERLKLVRVLKNMELNIASPRGFSEAIITAGGVKVKNINPSTMESKIIDGLYFAGEMIDVDALTGGFNLQVAWSTGFLAGESAASESV